MTGLGTSQRRGADDDDAPSASASRGQRAGVAAPEREFRLWPPQVTFNAGPLAARARGVGASLTPAERTGFDRDLGSLKPGKLADIVVLSRDLLAQRTFIGGIELN